MAKMRKGVRVETQPAPFDIDQLAPLAASMAGVGYWHFDEVGERFTWSEQIYKIYGYDPERGPPVLCSLLEFCHPDDLDRLRQHKRETGKNNDAEIEVRIVRADGEIRYVVSRSTVQLDAAGETVARFGTLIDITEMKRAEAVAKESEKRYRFMADYAPDMIAHSRIGGGAIYISPSSVRVLGFTPEELALLNPNDRVHPDDIERVRSAFGALVRGRWKRLPEPIRYRCKHKDGSWTWIEANPITVFDDQGAPIEFIDVVRNITQTKAFEEELEEARRRAEAAVAAKSAFLANMSHELRTPLTSIIGFSHLLGQRADLLPEVRHYARRISDASEALLSIINDVLDFSKLEANQVSLEMQPMSVRRLVDDTTGLITIQAEAKGVEIRTELDPKTPEMVTGDVARLRQVLLNLLSNAVKFTDKGSVTVKTAWRKTRKGGRLKVSVVDTGAGIAPEAVARLFLRFSQAELSINRTHGGTGLGLAISKRIIELMGGKIGVDTQPGQGSSFWFEVPADAAAEAEPHADAEAAAGCPALRILMVDDTAVNRELVRLMLEPLGLQIEEASGGAEGVQAAMVRPFDLILMDVRMPGVDGLQATQVIRAASAVNRRTPILALTADVQLENIAACRAAGMDSVLAKPIVPQQLIAQILRWGAGAEDPAGVAG